MLELLKDPNHKGLMSFHICSWKTNFAIIHLKYQKTLYEKGNEKYLDCLNKEIRRRQFWLKGDTCGCKNCSETYGIFIRVCNKITGN